MIEHDDFARLRRIGLTPFLLGQMARDSLPAEPLSITTDGPAADADPMPVDGPPPPAPCPLHRVVEVQRNQLLLHDGDGTRPARALPALLSSLDEQADALAVGDWVLARPDAHGAWWVHHRLPPANQIARRLHDGRDKVTRTVIVSNVDTALLTMGLDHDFNGRRLDRYATLVALAGVEAVVVLTKADLCADVERQVAEARARLPPTVPVLAVDGQSPAAAQALAPWLAPGRTLVLLGSSGAGKSTLTNTLCGAAVQATGGTRARDGRGRHTTTVRTLHVTPPGACIIDTPGLRALRLDTDEAALGRVFDDVATLAPACRFRNCRHQDEPGCAVREQLPAERLRSFHKLEREAARDTMSVLERQRQMAEWKVRARAGMARARAKRA